MAFIYRVIEDFDPRDVPEQNLVMGCADYAVVYKTAQGKGKTKTLVIAFRDPSGTWLVGAEPSVMAKLAGDQYSLQYWIDAGRPWHTWSVSGYDDSEKERVTFEKQVATISSGIPIDVSVTKPVSLGDNRFAVGCRPTVRSQLGSFRLNEVEKDASWIGSKVTDVAVVEKAVIVAEVEVVR